MPLSRGWPPLVPFDGDAGSRARHRPPPTLGFLLFRWFHLGLTAGCDYGGYGPPCVVLLIRTFLWLSAELPLSRGWPRSFLSTGTLARVLATVPLPPTLGFLLFRWFHLGLTAGCDYGGYGALRGCFDPNFPLAFC